MNKFSIRCLRSCWHYYSSQWLSEVTSSAFSLKMRWFASDLCVLGAQLMHCLKMGLVPLLALTEALSLKLFRGYMLCLNKNHWSTNPNAFLTVLITLEFNCSLNNSKEIYCAWWKRVSVHHEPLQLFDHVICYFIWSILYLHAAVIFYLFIFSGGNYRL